MAGTIKFVPYRTDDALTVPSTAVFDDDLQGTPAPYVYLAKADKDARYPRRRVATGKTANQRTEITSGLAEGDEILTRKP
jgi:multidrug efflux pump subunit AcrA (membrane-fusion protein)